MWTLYFTVFAIWPVVIGNNNFPNNNDWIPVSSDIINNQIRHENIPIPNYIATHNIQVINTDMKKVLIPSKKVEIQEEISDDTANIDTFELDCFPEGDNNCQNREIKMELDFVPNDFYYTSNENDKAKETVRQSKKLADSNIKNDAQLLTRKYKLPTKSNHKTYEVTEDNVENLFEAEESETRDTGYIYEPPKNQNMSKGLFEILSKYKINKDDELPNYAVSRRPKAQSLLKQRLPVKSFNNEFHYKYNNLNHLPVDPLLAVFLSNYGFYLQGMYGIRNHYNNLYGYLASNNIHNNRPFGFYKIFSDTDSSH